MSASIPPPRNLSPLAEPWGDWITQQTLQNREAIDRLGGDISNDGMLNNASSDLMADQIQELYERSTQSVPGIGSIATANFTTGTVFATQSFQLPRPNVPRAAWVSVSCVPYQSSAIDSAVFVTMDLDGTVFYRNSLALPGGLTTPPNWLNASMVGYCSYQAQPEAGGVITILLQASGFTGGGSHNVELVNIDATVNFGQRV